MFQRLLTPTISSISNTPPNTNTDIFYNCPKCNNFALIPEIHILNPTSIVMKCINNHTTQITKENITSLYPKIKKYSIDNLRCDFCSRLQNKDNVPYSYNFNEKKFMCKTCKIRNRNKIFEINKNKYIQIDKLFSNCIKHNKSYVGYCFDCNQNFCNDCQTHKLCTKIVHFYSILPEKQKINDFITEVCKNLSLLQNEERKVRDIIAKIKSDYESLRTFIKIKNELFLRVIQTYNHIKNNFLLINNVNEVLEKGNTGFKFGYRFGLENFIKSELKLLDNNLPEIDKNKINDLIDIKFNSDLNTNYRKKGLSSLHYPAKLREIRYFNEGENINCDYNSNYNNNSNIDAKSIGSRHSMATSDYNSLSEDKKSGYKYYKDSNKNINSEFKEGRDKTLMKSLDESLIPQLQSSKIFSPKEQANGFIDPLYIKIYNKRSNETNKKLNEMYEDAYKDGYNEAYKDVYNELYKKNRRKNMEIQDRNIAKSINVSKMESQSLYESLHLNDISRKAPEGSITSLKKNHNSKSMLNILNKNKIEKIEMRQKYTSEITIYVEVFEKKRNGYGEYKQSNLNKPIYFLCDRRSNCWEESYEELNWSNTKMFIDGIQVSFRKSHEFSMVGKHEIKFIIQDVITTCHSMFYKCLYITYVDLSNFKSEFVTDISKMFYGCENLNNVNFANFKTNNILSMAEMFSHCTSLVTINLDNFSTYNTIDMNSMFSNCLSLERINISNFNVEKVTNLSGLFMSCYSLTYVNMPNSISYNLQNISNMFAFCKNLNIINLKEMYLGKVKNISDIFCGCDKLEEIYCRKEAYEYIKSEIPKKAKVKFDHDCVIF